MQKASIEIEIPDGMEVTSVEQTGIIVDRKFFTATLRKAFQWPPWLKAKAIAMEKNGCWFAYSDVPTRVDRGWCSSGRWLFIDLEFFDFTPPEVTDWKQSLRINPNCK